MVNSVVEKFYRQIFFSQRLFNCCKKLFSRLLHRGHIFTVCLIKVFCHIIYAPNSSSRRKTEKLSFINL
jgi:hypothetical protein